MDDDEGPLVATLVRRIPNPLRAAVKPLRDVDVLYVHGWSDYFFQTELARFWNELGARFHALDLRRYGRSLRPGQTPGYIESLDDYDVDIEAALGDGTRRGCLDLAPSGAPRPFHGRPHPHAVGGASPGPRRGARAEQSVARAAARSARAPGDRSARGRARTVRPKGSHPAVDLGFYTRAQTDVGALPIPGYRSEWRPERGFPTHPAWLAAIIAGHRRVAAGVEVGCPALVLLSTRSTPAIAWSEAMTSTDSVLVVDDIALAATRIGRMVTIARIEGAIHDVFLSRREPRAEAYRTLEHWIEAEH